MEMFSGEFKNKNFLETSIYNISHTAFLEFLRYLYTDTLQDIKTHAMKLLQISHCYKVEALKQICEAELMKELNEENAAEIFQFAHQYECANDFKLAAFKLVQRSVISSYLLLSNRKLIELFLQFIR